MLETTKPMNVYYSQPESGYDSPAQSAESSRRNSVGFKDIVKKRRFSIVGRFTSSRQQPIPVSDGPRKTSGDSQLGDSPDDPEEDLSPRPLFQRRMSVPEKVFLSADYAILRPSHEPDVRFEIVAAFDRHTDPYRHYMQSLTCYDLAPMHGAVAVMDGNLMTHKALTSLIQSGHPAAIVNNLNIKGGLAMLTFTDCLKAIMLASKGMQQVAEQTIAQFIMSNNGKQLITADTSTSVWDTAKLICLNSTHRIPVVQSDDWVTERSPADILYMLSLKTVLYETVFKLSADSKFALGPHVKNRTLQESKIGTWNDLYTLQEDAKCVEAIEMFLERRISCIPVMSKQNKILGVLAKSDLMAELQVHPSNYLEILEMNISVHPSHFLKILDRPVVELLKARRPIYASPTMSLLEIITLLLKSDTQSIFVVNVEGHLSGVVSYADLMDYIQNSSDIHHKMSCA